MFRRILVPSVFVVFFSVLALSQKAPNTLGGLKARYLNKEIVIEGTADGDDLLGWTFAKSSDGRYVSDPSNYLPLKYRSQRATVIAVQLNELSSTGHETKNALGEDVSPDDAENPYVDIVVRLEDGQLAMQTSYPATLDEIALASEKQRVLAEMDKELPKVIGSNLYAAGFSELYPLNATLSDMSGPAKVLKQISITKIPLLTPITITKARYIPAENAVVLKLMLPDKTEALAFTSSSSLEASGPEESFISKIAGSLLSEIPKELTPKEIAAIRKGTLFRGMSKSGVEYAIGFPDKTNDWGRGGKQMVFFSGKLMVYLDSSEKVTDWQEVE